MRRCRRSGLLALNVSEIAAAEEVGASLRSLFRNERASWRRVEDELERRRINRDAVSFSRGHIPSSRQGNASDRAAEEAARAQLLAPVNRLAFDVIADRDHQISAENALIRAAESDPESVVAA